MVSNQADIDFSAVQSLTNFTDNSQQEQSNHSNSHSRRNNETVQGGLAGSVQTAAFSAGQERDGDWQRVFRQNQLLVDNNHRAVAAYYDGQDSAQSAMSTHNYGASGIINPA